MKQVLYKKYCLTIFKKSLSGWKKEFEEEYEQHIINLLIEIRAEGGIGNTALRVGRERLMGIKTMANSAYTVSSLLRILHRDYPNIVAEGIEKIKKMDRTVTSKEEQLVSAKAHEYHTLTEEMNLIMRLLIDFDKLKAIKELKGRQYNHKTWTGILNILDRFSSNNKFLDYLKENVELRNAIAHCSIWYNSGVVYYYPQELAKEEPKDLPLDDFIKKTRELNILVIMFLYIITQQL